MKNTDYKRTSNNTLRHEYRTLNDAEKKQISDVKNLGEVFLGTIDELGSSHELSIAKTKIEEAVFWAVKDITS